VPVVVYEAGKEIAGLAKSFCDDEGFTYDFGAHFITNRLAAAIGVGAYCRDVRHYGETVRVDGRTYSYPYGLASSPSFLFSALATAATRKRRPEPTSVAEWFRLEYGDRLAEAVAIPLVERWSGVPATELAPSVGEKLKGGVAHVLRLKLAARMTKRAVAHGYCREQPESVHVWHVYPEGSLGLLCERLASGLEDAIRLESPVEGIIVDGDRVVAVRVKGREQEVSAVMSTAPVHILAKLVEGTTALKHLARFKYRPMVFANLRFHGRGLLPEVVVWTPGGNFPFFRLTEAPLSMPWLAPEGKTLITADLGCEIGDAIWKMSEEELGEFCVEKLAPIIPDARRRYLGCRVLRTPVAYPVFLKEYEAERRSLEKSTGVKGLYSIGRNGEFSHLLMEDTYWRTLRRVHELLMVA
jgi:protoporphyrinogen oxidase